MIKNEIEDIEDDDEEFELVQFDINKIREKIPTYTSKKLCEMIVCDRYFGCYKDMSVSCMEELAKRRSEGDDFQFEEVINKSMEELPPLNFAIPDLGNTLRTLIGQVKGK